MSVWDNNVTYTGLVLGGVPSLMLLSALVSPLVCVVLLNVTILPVACDELTLYLVQSPFGVCAPG